jgi:L,D-peptidoglycan transpeptidase YkuD (ErfK/YbiS/YcfS/YnhG family)
MRHAIRGPALNKSIHDLQRTVMFKLAPFPQRGPGSFKAKLTRRLLSRAPVTPKSAPKKLCRLVVTVQPKTAYGMASRGRLFAGPVSFPCALGAASVKRRKKEGDLASPAGQFRLLGGYFRPPGTRPTAPWPLRPIGQADGWCDDPRSPAYNRFLRLPSAYSYEKLWRNDGLYDLVIVLDYNLWPQRKRGGSAIFLHCAGPDFAPTAGCIALQQADLRKLLPRLAKHAVLVVK